MSPSPRQRQMAHRPSARRQGNTFTFSLVALAGTIVMASAGWWMFVGRGGAEDGPELILNEVGRGAYDFVVIEQGTVESGSNVELRCQVRARGGGGGGGGGERGGGGGGGSTTIIDVVPEGTMVKEGEWVVKLDSSSLEIEENSQKIQVSSRESMLTQAENALSSARIAKEEYLKGTFVEAEKLIKSELYVAEQTYKTAEQGLKQAKALLEKNIITGLQLESAQYAVDNANNLLDGAKTKLWTLQNLTKARMLTDLDAQIATQEAAVKAQQAGLDLETSKLRDIQDQIEKCTIKATAAGQVVYANQYDSWRGSSSAEFVVTPGTMVRERQVIIRLPNAEDMQVKATVNEARVTLVRPGLPVTIRVDALKDDILEGEVTKVNQYAEPGSFSSGNIKKYATFVKIKNPPPDLRVGMNAEVRIHVERQADALQVPVQALAEVKNHYFTLVKNGEKYETREIKIGTTNDKVATIEDGLKEGDLVVMNPRNAGGLLVLPNFPDPTPAEITEVKRTDPAEAAAKLAEMAKGGPPGGGKADGQGGGKGGGKRGGGNFSPAMLVDRAMNNDEDKDGKLSVAEMDKMDDRAKRWLDGADKNKDGFIERIEMLTAATAFVQRMQEQGGGRGGGGGGGGGPPGGGGGRRGGGEGGANGAGPAGGGE